MAHINRRDFLKRSSGAALGAGLGVGCATNASRQRSIKTAANTGKASPSETIRMGLIGAGGRGQHDMDRFMFYKDVEFVAVADVFDEHLDRAVEQTGGKAKGYKDFRKLLERDDIDAVIVATPPHWHPLATILACEAGKDVYCEKPMCLTPAEGAGMLKAARENNRITQIGTQIHAEENYHRVVEIVQSGVIGDISCVRAQLNLNEAPDGIGNEPNSEPPAGLDWDMWCGPKPMMPFNKTMFTGGRHRYFEPLIGNWIHEMGPHIVDLAYWAMNPGTPKSATASGGKFVTKDMSTIADTMDCLWEFDNFVMTWSNLCGNAYGLGFQRESTEPWKNGIATSGDGRRLGVSFHGTKGTVLADYDWHAVYSEGERLKEADLPEPYLPRSVGHAREFLDGIKSRTQPRCSVEYHYPLAVALNLGFISYKLGRKVHYDGARGVCIGDKEANGMLAPEYRAPWELPV